MNKYEDEAQINHEVCGKLPLVVLAALVVVVLSVVGAAVAVRSLLFALSPAEKDSCFATDIKPKEGRCGLATDFGDEVERFKHSYPDRLRSAVPRVEKTEFGLCYVRVTICYYGEPILVKPAPARPATLGGEAKNSRRI